MTNPNPSRRRYTKAALSAPFLLAKASYARRTPTKLEAVHALNRLGYGPTLVELDNIEKDPRAWVAQQLSATQAVDSPFASMNLMETVRSYVEKNQQSNAREIAPGELGSFIAGYTLPAAQTRLFRALSAPTQLEEVMVEFWFNHFNVFQNKNLLRVMVGHYEHHAIRPHVMGRFADLLKATAHHPAMLYYLDNVQSFASAENRSALSANQQARGLNENYARELMELHTLGVDGGYTQRDVTELARMLTGWTMESVNRNQARLAPGSTPTVELGPHGFMYNDRIHDRAEKFWLGRRVAAAGKREGDEALEALATHPATAKHIAFKLAQYFVSDNPPKDLVERLTKIFLDTGGQIRVVLNALFASDAFWQESSHQAKYKSPYHYLISALRLSGQQPRDVRPMLGSLASQGMPLFQCVTPDGYKNTEQAWLNPDAMSKRINTAARIAVGRLGEGFLSQGHAASEILALAGPWISQSTRSVILEQKDQANALTFLLASPEMMKR